MPTTQQLLVAIGAVLRPSFVAVAQTQTGVTGTLTISKPTGTQENDLLLAFMATSDVAVTKTWTGDTGWTEVADSGTSPGLRIAWKIAGASEGASYSFTCSDATLNLGGCILTYRYVNQSTPISAGGTIQRDTTAGNATTLTASSITVPNNTNILIAPFFASHGDTTALSTPAGMTLRDSNFDILGPAWSVFDQNIESGSTGTRVSTISVAGAPTNHAEMSLLCIAHA